MEMTPNIPGIRKFFSVSGATGPLIGLLLLCLFLSIATDSFLSFRNFLNIFDQITVLGIMAVGMTFVILIGGIDLSVGSVMALEPWSEALIVVSPDNQKVLGVLNRIMITAYGTQTGILSRHQANDVSVEELSTN